MPPCELVEVMCTLEPWKRIYACLRELKGPLSQPAVQEGSAVTRVRVLMVSLPCGPWKVFMHVRESCQLCKKEVLLQGLGC